MSQRRIDDCSRSVHEQNELNTSDYRMERTSITRWSEKAGAGGIGCICQEIRGSKGWRTKREGDGKDCGPIRIQCRRGSGGGENNVSRQTLFLGVAELGFRLRHSQWDTDFLAKIIVIAVHRHQIKPATTSRLLGANFLWLRQGCGIRLPANPIQLPNPLPIPTRR